jgi:pilus assembly protein CpaC
MFSRKIGSAVIGGALVVAALAGSQRPALAQAHDRLRVPVGRAEVVTSNDDVRTVAIAEPKIADAAVGSARTVVVNGKSPGITTLVVYSEGARYKVYDVECYTPNYNQQVLLRVRVAEVNDNAARQLGFDWFGTGHSNAPWLDGYLTGGILTSKISPYTDNPPGLTVGPETDGFLGYLKNSNDLKLEVTWKALEEKGDLRTLATPTLVTRSGQPASFLSGGEIPVPIASGTGAQSNTVTIEWKEFGVKLDFTPTVEEDNSITLKVAPEMSQLDFSNITARTSAGTVPSLITRKASTVVNLRPGEHLAIGGLKQTDKVRITRKVPILGYIPLLGFFFTDSDVESVDHDLLVVVSPELVTPEANLPQLPTDKKGH